MSSSKSRNSNSSDFLNDECDDESFLLDWNNHTFSMTSSLSLIRERQDLVDVTIVAGQNDTSTDDEDDEQDEDIESRHCRSFGAHKVILSACSPYLRRLLRGLSSWQHPVLVFREIPADDLEAILTFVRYLCFSNRAVHSNSPYFDGFSLLKWLYRQYWRQWH